MLSYLNIFDLHNVNIYAIKNKNFAKMVLGMPNRELSKDNKIALFVLNNYFEKFLTKNYKFLYSKLEVIIFQRGYDLDDNIKDIILPFISRYFKEYVLKFEIEIACDIEREKSPYYKSMMKFL